MKRFNGRIRRFGYIAPHTLNSSHGYRGGIRL